MAEVRDLSFEKNGNILIQTIRPGEGDLKPHLGHKVFVHYKLMLKGDTTVLDNSRDREEPLSFVLGKGQVVKGWDVALRHMQKGEIARVTLAPEFAYGAEGYPKWKIPPNATLEFEIELLDWKEVDITPAQDGGVTERIIKQGEGMAKPNDGATVTIKYTASCEGKIFESREVTFTQGEGNEQGLIPALEMATRKMERKKQVALTVAPKYGYGEKGCPELGVPPNATLNYDVEMINFEKLATWNMDVGEKLAHSKTMKEKGTKVFTNGNYREATKHYRQIVSVLEHETTGLKDEEAQERQQLLLAAYLNIAMCKLKLHCFAEAGDACNSALELDPNNVKAFFRRGQSLLERWEYTKAAEDFNKVLELEPSNKAAKNQIIVCKRREKEALAKEKQLYSNMFQKMAEKSGGGDNLYKTMPQIEEWNNDMAKDMMPLQDEADAFADVSDYLKY